jgi:transposase-like protein
MGNGYYDERFKATMVRKLVGPPAVSASALAAEVGVAQTTLSRWLKDYGRLGRSGGEMSSKKRPQNWSAEAKLSAILEYEKLEDEESRGKYLREHGLYTVDIERWRGEVLGALGKKPQGKKGDPKERRIRDLEAELRRKEKALAETAALLVLKKKADAIWGDDEGER